MSTPIPPCTPDDSAAKDAPSAATSELIQPPTFRFAPGEIIAGKYRIQRLLRDAGPAVLVAATHVGFDEAVAVKLLKPELARDPETVTRFAAQARLSFKIDNPHVARVLDVDTVGGDTPFVVMELPDGDDLRSILRREADLPIERAVDLTLQLCEALAAAHACQITARDIKPETVFVTDSVQGEYVKVFDFGVSEAELTEQQATRKTRTTSVGLGALAYMSPEQIRASNRLDARADQWSLGCVLYELLTGVAPFQRLSPMQTCAAILEDEPLPLREWCPGASAELEAALVRCLRKDPTDRYRNISELALAIAPFGARFVGCAQRCSELLAPGHRRSTVAAPKLTKKLAKVEVESSYMSLTEADLLAAEELAAEEPNTNTRRPRKQRWIWLAVSVLTALSSAYLAIRWMDAAQNAVSPRPSLSAGELHPAHTAAATHESPATAPAAESRSPMPPPHSSSRSLATSNLATPDPATFEPAIPATKSTASTSRARPNLAAAEEPDVGF